MIWKSSRFNNVIRTLLFMPFTVSLVCRHKGMGYVYTDVLMPLTGMPQSAGNFLSGNLWPLRP